MATLTADGIDWFCSIEGGGHSRAILFLHGFTGGAASWDEIVAELRDEFCCVTVDLPGHGRTLAPPNLTYWSQEWVAGALVRLLAQIGIDRPILWGYSMGGRLALKLAVAHPGCISHLILESASPGIADDRERSQRRVDDERLAERIETGGVPAFVTDWERLPLFARQRDLPRPKQDRLRRLRLGHDAAGLAMSLRGMGSGVQDPLHEHLGEVSVPTLVMTGEYDRKFRIIGETLATGIRTAASCVVPAAGHAVYWEQPENCLRTVRWFLRSADDTGVAKP